MCVIWMANEFPSNDAVLMKLPHGSDTAATIFRVELMPQEELRPEIIHAVKGNV